MLRVDQRRKIANAVAFLKLARDSLKDAEAPRALARVRTALKSTEGALRHKETQAADQIDLPSTGWGS